MALLFRHYLPPYYEQHGPGEGEEGGWWCDCPHGLDHTGPKNPTTGKPPHACEHLSELWAYGDEGKLSGRFIPTAAGDYRADHCRCRGATEEQCLQRMPPPKVPAPLPPGQPSRNKPCPCGNIRGDGNPLLYKYCHGASGGPPPNAPPYPGAPVAEEPPPEPPPAETPAQKGARTKRRNKGAKVTQRKELDRIIDAAKKKDEIRRQKDRDRRAAKKKEPKK